MKTYVKIEGKDVKPIVQRLAKLAIDLQEVCVFDINLEEIGWDGTPHGSTETLSEEEKYFGLDNYGFQKLCDRVITKTDAKLGDSSIYFEWTTPPNKGQLDELRREIEAAIKPYGNKYTIRNEK